MQSNKKVPVIIIADDHPLFRNALIGTIEETLPECLIYGVGGLNQTRQLMRSKDDVDLLLLDLTMPDVDGFLGLIWLKAEFSEIPIIVVSAVEDIVVINRCIQLGASGFIPKSSSPNRIADCVKTVLAGGNCIPPIARSPFEGKDKNSKLVQKIQNLTPRQAITLSMLATGFLNRQIAQDLGISEATVKAHVSAVLLKLGVSNRTQAVIALTELTRSLSAGGQSNFVLNETKPTIPT